MAKLIGCSNTENYGENYFISKATEYLDDTNIIYWNRQIFGREFDICILMPNKGILVVELKGWREENILRVENNEYVVIQTENGEINSNPQKQARGYRFSLDRYIKQNINKFPLVFQMVCLPQVSKQFYHNLRLDIVMEERFTILKEDLTSKVALYNKLDQALREVSNWNRDDFNHRTMLEVRNLFETDVDLDETKRIENETLKGESFKYHQYDYSRFYYFDSQSPISEITLKEITEHYFSGCKIFGVFSNIEQMKSVISSIDNGLNLRSLKRNRDNIELLFDDKETHIPTLPDISNNFLGFNCSFSVVSSQIKIPSFCIKNGEFDSQQDQWLKTLEKISQFNREQYLVEHTSPDKNIVIRAGAGTGKTHTMISRIGYICYSQNVSLQKMAERIVMITFTNEAAEQMEEKIKMYFRNCYLITSKSDYLHMISRVDNMQISTIHSYAKDLIAKLGTSFGYGIDLSITSSEFYRRKKVSDLLDAYIRKNVKEYGTSYTAKLGMPVYAIRDSILDFISKLHNKSINVGSIEAQDFGNLLEDNTRKELHELLASVIPAVEREYFEELLDNNKIHLSSMMALLNRFISDPDSADRIRELKKDKNATQFMFVDEFQDTDDSQIESLLRISELLNYRLFVVGDIKQCIYRFRGAKEKAFDQLKIAENKSTWTEYSLQRNYRTDAHLLKLFDSSFSVWGNRDDELLTYDINQDKLIGTKDYNGEYLADKSRFYKCLPAMNEDQRIPILVNEIRRIQKRIDYEVNKKEKKLSQKEKSIAILVRENWQADIVRTECAKFGISVQTNTGGDLYMSQPALDMMTLVNALVHFDEADYLYTLVASNFFSIDIPKSNLFEIRSKIKKNGWLGKADEKDQVNYLIDFMNKILVDKRNDNRDWEHIISILRTQPILQALRKIYSILEPWKQYSTDAWKQHYYQLNVDLLFEQIINACNVDKLTINTLQEFLYNSIVSQVSVDSRTPSTRETDIPIQCITVHKSKGLEYGHVIMPFCSASINHIKNTQLQVSTQKEKDHYKIGYSLHVRGSSETIKNDFYDEEIEKSEKSREETRVLYVAMTRAIRSFSWIEIQGKQNLSWQNLIEKEV